MKAARRLPSDATAFRSRRLAPPSAEGRWTLVAKSDDRSPKKPPLQDHKDATLALRAGKAPAARRLPRDGGQATGRTTKWAAAVTQQLLARHGVLTREAIAAEAIPGGFGVVYPVLKGLEENGRIRRGYFVAGLGATQFALPGALDLLRSMRDAPDDLEIAVLAATDPANPYGATLKWPTAAANPNAVPSARQAGEGRDAASRARRAAPLDSEAAAAKAGRGATRSVGATVILVNGAIAAYLARGDRVLLTFLPDAEPDRSKVARAVASVLIERARWGGDAPRGMLIEEIDGAAPAQHPMAPFLAEAGFISGALGFQATFRRSGGAAASGRQERPGVPADSGLRGEPRAPDRSAGHE
jgi:ATP-dependent Lhr-like helicase